MKTWMMVYLWALNAVYWPAFGRLDQPESQWAAISYIAIAPNLVVMLPLQRGLTRLTGLIHIPWLIYVIWLGLRLFTDLAGSAANSPWLQVVFWSTLACVLYDITDVVKWFQGHRYRYGTPVAVTAGASKPADTGWPTASQNGPPSL